MAEGEWLRDGVKSRVPRYSLLVERLHYIAKKKKTHEIYTCMHVCMYILYVEASFSSIESIEFCELWGRGDHGDIEILGKWEEEVTKGWMLNEQPIERWSMVLCIFNGYGGWELFVDFCGIILFIVKRK